jgi:hypothetical protein
MGEQRNRRLISIAAVLLVGLFLSWYYAAANYDYDALAGVYILDRNGERCVLSLRSNHTFTEELTSAGTLQKAEGTWHRYGESHVSFSMEFLRVSGEELNASGESHGEFEKRLGLFTVLTLAPLPNGPEFHKRIFGSSSSAPV